MRIGLLLCVAICATAVAHPSQELTKKKDDKPVIVVTGCVDGSWLDVRRSDPVGSYVTRYKLRGSRQLMSELRKKFEGHLLEVTGAVTDTGSTVHRGKTIDVGKKTRIHTGAKEVPARPSGTGDPELEISSVRDLNEKCR